MQSTPGVSVTIGGNHTAAVVRSWWSIIPRLNGSLLSSLAQAGRQGGMSVGQGGSSPSSQVTPTGEAKKAHYQANYCNIFLLDLQVTAPSRASVDSNTSQKGAGCRVASGGRAPAHTSTIKHSSD